MIQRAELRWGVPMAIKSLLDGVLGKKQANTVEPAAENNEEVIDYLWMTEDDKKNKKKKKLAAKKDPRIDTAILRNRIADKVAKMNNH